MSDYPFNIPAGLDIGQFLTFSPTAAIVSNYSPYYIYFPDGLNFCPPWTVGAVIPLAHATYARATWKDTPFGLQAIGPTPVGVVYTALITFTDGAIAASGGTGITNPFLSVKSRVDVQLHAVAGSYPQVVLLPTGSIIDGGSLSAVCETVAGLGMISVYLWDGIGGQPFSYLNQVICGVNPINAPMNSDPIFPALSPTVDWTLTFLIQDIVGTNTYSVAQDLYYR